VRSLIRYGKRLVSWYHPTRFATTSMVVVGVRVWGR
jgi:hypothetical protein